MLNARTKLSPYDQDCYILYACTGHLRAGADPDYSWMATTEAYKRGSEIREALQGPIIPVHLDPEWSRKTMASITFLLLHGRHPLSGEVLHYSDVLQFWNPDCIRLEVEKIQGAWARRLSECTCPFRYEDGNMLIRQEGGTWKPFDLFSPILRWRTIENEALGRNTYCPHHEAAGSPYQPAIPAVVFSFSEGGKRRAVPLSHSDDSKVERALAPEEGHGE